jgi:hypothetical protein
MKSKILLRIAFLLVTALLIVACTKSDIEKARDAYSAAKVFPTVQSISGPAVVLKTFRYPYTVSGAVRAGSTMAWTGVDCVIDSLSANTATAYVKFTTLPASDTAKIKVIETTEGGVASVEKMMRVKVNPFCPLVISGFVGTYGGTDGGWPSEVVITAKNSTSVTVTGLNNGWILNDWGETITAGGSITLGINVSNGTISIADQYLFTTDYNGAVSTYGIKATTGLWSNCGAKPTITFNYQIYYLTGGSGTYPSASTYFTAALVKI